MSKTNVTARPIMINFENPTEPMAKRRRKAIQEHREGNGPPVAIRPTTSDTTPCPGLLDKNSSRNY
jgi:hypothetical protein